jgi:hypothetical protein
MVHLFSNQKSQFGKILECLAMKDVGKFYGHLVNFPAILYIFGPFDIFLGNFGIFLQLFCKKKNTAEINQLFILNLDLLRSGLQRIHRCCC